MNAQYQLKTTNMSLHDEEKRQKFPFICNLRFLWASLPRSWLFCVPTIIRYLDNFSRFSLGKHSLFKILNHLGLYADYSFDRILNCLLSEMVDLCI